MFDKIQDAKLQMAAKIGVVVIGVVGSLMAAEVINDNFRWIVTDILDTASGEVIQTVRMPKWQYDFYSRLGPKK